MSDTFSAEHLRQSQQPRFFRGNMICMVSMLTWAMGFPAAEHLLETWDPLSLALARFVVAILVLVPVWLAVDGMRSAFNVRWGKATVTGGLGFGVGACLMIWAQDLSDPVTVAIVASTMPLIGLVLEVFLDGRRLRLMMSIGVIVAIAGGIVAAGAGIEGASVGLSALLAFGSCVMFTWASRVAVKDFPELSRIGQTTVTLVGGFMFTFAVFALALLLGFDTGPSAPMDIPQFGALLVYAIGAMALSQLLWLIGVGNLGIALASFHVNVAPFWVMLFVFMLGGLWNWTQALGAFIVLCGVAIAQRGCFDSVAVAATMMHAHSMRSER